MRLVRSILALAIGLSGCAGLDADPPAAPPTDRQGALLDYRTRAARDLAILLGDGARRAALIASLRAGPVAVGAVAEVDDDLGIADFTGFDAVPELWLLEPAGSSLDDLVVAYAPSGEEATWTEVPAFAPGGDPVALDAIAEPTVPVVVIETHGRLAFRRGIAEANRTLAAMGMQRAPAADKAVGRMTVRLDQIRITDDQEPWVSGAAEVYAIGSGVIGDNEPQLRIVELPYLDYAGTTYTPRQIVLDWNDYAYQAANAQLFEHDDSTSYQTLVVELVAAVGAIGSLAGYPEIQAVTEIASRIVSAMPAGWFSNDDDYLDSFYTLEKNASYTGLPGAARNATVTLVPYYLAPN
jgi:hypothetical protein